MGRKKKNEQVRSRDVLLQIYVPAEIKQAFEEHAAATGASMSELGSQILLATLPKSKQKQLAHLLEHRRRPKMDEDVVARILEMKATMTCQKIADVLNKERLLTPRGLEWNQTRVWGVVTRHRED